MGPEELSHLWRLYNHRLLLVARAIGEPAEDAVQEAFLRLSQQTVTPDDPMAWLVRSTRNLLLEWRRQGLRRDRRDQEKGTQLWFSALEHNQHDEASTNPEAVTHALASLSDEQRQIVVMHLWGTQTFAQIAALMGSSRATVHRRYVEAIAMLRSHLTEPSTSRKS